MKFKINTSTIVITVATIIIAGLVCKLILTSVVAKNSKENIDNHITFFNKDDVINFLIEDKDDYVKNMSKADLYARKSRSYYDYLDKIATCSCSFNDKEKNKLIVCAKKADQFLMGYKYKNILDCSDIARIPWKFALTKKNETYYFEYESGLPHTRSDVIFLSEYTINDNITSTYDNDMLVNTLIHEKIHIYQRLTKKSELSNLIRYMGYTEVPITHIQQSKLLLKRCNPDINDKIYSKDGKIIIFVYKTNKPYGINDVEDNNFTTEHPYEAIAYDLSDQYLKQKMKTILDGV